MEKGLKDIKGTKIIIIGDKKLKKYVKYWDFFRYSWMLPILWLTEDILLEIMVFKK